MIHGILSVLQETFFERPLVQEGLLSTVFHDSMSMASSSQEFRPDISETDDDTGSVENGQRPFLHSPEAMGTPKEAHGSALFCLLVWTR